MSVHFRVKNALKFRLRKSKRRNSMFTTGEGISKTNKQRNNYLNKNIIVKIFLILKHLFNNNILRFIWQQF